VLRARQIEPSVALLVAGLALACYLQGAFFPRAQIVVAIPLVVAAFLASRLPIVTRPDLPVVFTAAVLAAWALADGVLTGQLLAGARYVLLIASVLGVIGLCRRLSDAGRTTLVNGLLAACCVVAVTGWLGVVANRTVWGFFSAGMWRASSTLTYPNATAAVLTMSALVCLALRSGQPATRWLGWVATVLVTGLAATLSRAGLGGFVVGLCVLGWCVGWRPLFRGAAGPLLGALVATTALLPAVITDTATVTTVGVAGVGAVAGLVIGGRVRASRPVLAVVAAVLAAALVLLSVWLPSRLTLASPDRWSSFRAGWDVFLRHPLTGAGPGIDRLVLARATGGVSVFRFVHNEYLQTLAELGVLGAVLLVAFVALVLRRLWRDRSATGVLGAGGLATVTALALHAGFDFVWHIPAIPLVSAAFVGVALARPEAATDREDIE
jgi:O-antigen ligase